ncbi:fimbrial protein [Pseudomonas protegens]|uniref:fimbrial protein n=1 Tax=Pseudomonas protegens TaxID=380021 RepID=UPI0037F6E235
MKRNPRTYSSRHGKVLPLLALLALPGTEPARAQAGSDDQTAILQVSGALLESACHLDVGTAYQEVWLGELSTARLSRPGDQGTPVAVTLKLRDCVRTRGGRREAQGGTLVWSAIEPVMGLRFSAVADPDSPQLVKVQGAGGFGLRLTDARQRPIALGRSGHTWFVSPGSNLLTYYITPERTAAPLLPGHFRANLNFHMSYD